MNNFGRGPPKDHLCEINSKLGKGFRRSCRLSQLLKDRRSRTDTLTVGYFLGTYSVRKSSQGSIGTQQIPVNFYDINLILSKLAPFICQLGLFCN